MGCVFLTIAGACICVSFSNFDDVVLSSLVSNHLFKLILLFKEMKSIVMETDSLVFMALLYSFLIITTVYYRK
jgi:hypothetical protein